LDFFVANILECVFVSRVTIKGFVAAAVPNDVQAYRRLWDASIINDPIGLAPGSSDGVVKMRDAAASRREKSSEKEISTIA
jgi:hypothetical protein